MVLLTSSQVQVALSSAIIVSFTLILFLAGYVAQQKSVASIHAAIRPKAPSPRHKSPDSSIPHVNPTARISRPLGRLRDRLQWQTQLTAADAPFNWNNYAYAQLVRDHSEVCNALILFSDLHRLRSAAPRLLLFPQHWMKEDDGETLDPFLETSRRLIKKASRRYRVTLVPITPNIAGKKEDDPEAYSMAALAALDRFEKLLTFTPPGLILEAKALDSILVFAETNGIAAYPALNNSKASTILVTPSQPNQELLAHQTLHEIAADTLVSHPEDKALFTSSYALRTENPGTFNATGFLESTAYIQFSDPDLPDPEYDIPYTQIVKMRPTGEDQGFLWEKMYSTYKDRRYGVCGLDLEAWPPVTKQKEEMGEDTLPANEDSDEGKTDL